MTITKTLLAGAAGVLLTAGAAAAGEPTKLTATEMDTVTAGFYYAQAETRFVDFFSAISGTTDDLSEVSGSDTTTINSVTNFTIKATAKAGTTQFAEGSGGLTPLGPVVLDVSFGGGISFAEAGT